MIQANKPEVNVDELMEKIRGEVARRHSDLLANSSSSSIHLTVDVNLDYIEALLNNAESRSGIRTKWPDGYNRFPFNVSKSFQKLAFKILEIIFRDQREVNFNLLQASRQSLLLNKQLIEQIANLQARIKATDSRLNTVDGNISTTNTRLNTLNGLVNGANVRLNAIDQRVEAIAQQSTTTEQHLQTVDWRVEAIAQQVTTTEQRVEAIAQQVTTTEQHLQTVDQRVETSTQQITTTEQHLQTVDQRVETSTQQITTTDQRLNIVDERVGAIVQQSTTTEQHLQIIDQRVDATDERQIRDYSYLKNDLADQQYITTLFLEEARQCLPKPFNQEQLQTFINQEQHLLDAFYFAFEDKFRGSYEDIIDRLKVYLPLIVEAKVGSHDLPILDVGCGRGEWLELLRKDGYTAYGLDTNRVMIDQCRARGLNVVEADVISYLQLLPNASLGAVTGFHIIEHLPFEVLIKLFDETRRVLKSGGLIIFETPNPRNVLVGSGDFYRDPTHRNPVHPDTISFIAKSKGFVRNESYFFEDKDGKLHLQKSSEKSFNDLKDYVDISRDYALVAYKL